MIGSEQFPDLGTVDIWDQHILVWGAGLCTLACLAISLASAH